VRLDLNQWITQRVDFLAVVFVGEQAELDGTMWFHRQEKNGFQNRVILPSLPRVGERQLSSWLSVCQEYETAKGCVDMLYQ